MDVILTKDESGQFGRVNASERDFAEASFCASYLLKQKWHCLPWTRRGTIYQRQTAFVTNLVIAYARPFNKSKDWPGLPINHRKLFNEDELRLHDVVIKRRNEIFAHSDSDHHDYAPFPFENTYITIEGHPFSVMSEAECRLILCMLAKLSARLKDKRDEIYQRAERRQNSPS